jgi:hypothetical protein
MSGIPGQGLGGPLAHVIKVAHPGTLQYSEPAEGIRSRRSLTEVVSRGSGRAGMPEPMTYDLSRPHLKAREAEVAAMVAAAKAEAARRHARRSRG